MMEPDVRRRWTKAAPTLPLVSEPSVSTVPPVFEPSEKRRISSSEGGGGKTRSWLKFALVGMRVLSGRGKPARSRTRKVWRQWLQGQVWVVDMEGGRPQERLGAEFHSLAIR